jgi:hypothetical protein
MTFIILAFDPLPIAALISLIIIKLLPESAVLDIIFGGTITAKHKTKYFINQLTDRYKASINGLNRSLAFNVGFAILALYAFLALPSSGTITIPFVSLPVSRLIWVSLVPLFSYGLQTLTITSFIWYLALRRGVKLLSIEIEASEDFGDATNILLDGALGQVWIVFKISRHWDLVSRLNFIWYLPAIILILVVLASPLLLCIYFIIQLFILGSIFLGIVYSILFIPYSALFLLLISTSASLSIENMIEPSPKKTETEAQISSSTI